MSPATASSPPFVPSAANRAGVGSVGLKQVLAGLAVVVPIETVGVARFVLLPGAAPDVLPVQLMSLISMSIVARSENANPS
jgi:hypothetical protein